MIDIPLSQGQIAKIDDEFAELASLKWYAAWNHSTRSYYAVRTITLPCGKRTREPLHRAVMRVKLGRKLIPGRNEQVDHRNHDTLDCRIANLRLAGRTKNMRNRLLNRNSTSGYKGVSWHKAARKWYAQIGINGRRIALGVYDTPELAAFAYNLAAYQYHGEFAKINESVM